MKYQYSAGLIGYGAKGASGSDGFQGMSMYFTDFDAIFNMANIENAIENNYVLWSSAPPQTSLPLGKTYVTGDLLVDAKGDIFTIDAETFTFSPTVGKFSKVDFFEWLTDTPDGFGRYYNINNPSEGYLIDNVRMLTPNDYVTGKTIYGVPLKEFTRIEYCDISENSKNAFSLYSTAENKFVDDNQSLAIVYDVNTESFRIGNVDFLDTIRNTSLTLDASLVIHNRPHNFGLNTPDGNILTNREINPITLFNDPSFNAKPLSFYSSSSLAHKINVYWTLADFASGSGVSGDLYFSKDSSTVKVYNLLDVSEGSSIILHNVEPTGYVTFDGLKIGQRYNYHMMVKQDGWERSSDISTRISL